VKEYQAKHNMAGLKILMPQSGETPAAVFSFPGQHVVAQRSDWWTVKASTK
jgi:hypothetical protein